MKKIYSYILLLSILLGAAFAFQNCGKVRFAKDGAELIAKQGEPVTATDENPEDLPQQDPPQQDPPVQDPPAEDPVAENPDDGALIYICILEEAGKSIHIGYSNGLVADRDTPISVCMSKNACLNIASEIFPVVSAEYRGFCPDKNPHVIPMTDEEITAGIEALAAD